MSPPTAIVVFGVSGSGKTTIGELLAQRLEWEFADADDFHPPANIEKMRAGTPLTDDDRWPWLTAIAAHIRKTRVAGRHVVVGCSALKRAYREVLTEGAEDVQLVYLKGEIELVAERQAARHGHFMPGSLLQSQFDALEEPAPDERPLVLRIDQRPDAIVGETISRLNLVPAT